MMMNKVFSLAVAGCFLLASCKNDSGVSTVKEVTPPAGSNAELVRNTATATAPADTTNVAKMTFKQTVYDFGKVKQGAKVTHEFEFTNDGKVPLLITNARATCGCTVPEWPKEPIPVGGTSKISATFNTEGKNDNQTKDITITANTHPTDNVVTIKGFVEGPGKKDGAELKTESAAKSH